MRLVSSKTNHREAEKILPERSECVALLNSEFRFHRILSVVLADDVAFDSNLNELTAIKLFRAKQLNEIPAMMFWTGSCRSFAQK
jgi:hypothetical protein